MNRQRIDGRDYAEMLFGGATLLQQHADEVNDLNVFPVPDGDTGINMARTIEGGLSEIGDAPEADIGALSERFSKGILMGARGNSGVILSQIFAGISEELRGHGTVGARELAEAYRNGIKKSYAAVQNPTEGTILTVFRESTEYAAANITHESTVEDFYKLHIECARKSLERTKELLPVLAEAGVVDSGAAGYLYIVIGMYEALTGELVPSFTPTAPAASSLDIDSFTRDSVLEFGYCTEFMLRLMSAKCDPDTFEVSELISVLEALGGESIVAYKTGDLVKVHVHTMTPGQVFAEAQRWGEFLTVKVENMSIGHSGESTPKKPDKKYSVLAVASGEGISALFTDMGADGIIAGGQTQNPSTEEFVSAFKECASEHIIVLPNNKNVFMAAKQAADIYDGAKVHIVPTKNLMQGYGALSVITPGITDMDALVESVTRAAASVIGSEITRAVRDVTINGVSVREGDYIAITEGAITAVCDSPEAAVMEMLRGVDMDEYEIVTLFVGADVGADARAELTELIEEEYPDCEVVVYEGGQEVYHYMVAIE